MKACGPQTRSALAASMAASGQEYAFRVPLNRVWNVAVNRRSGPAISWVPRHLAVTLPSLWFKLRPHVCRAGSRSQWPPHHRLALLAAVACDMVDLLMVGVLSYVVHGLALPVKRGVPPG